MQTDNSYENSPSKTESDFTYYRSMSEMLYGELGKGGHVCVKAMSDSLAAFVIRYNVQDVLNIKLSKDTSEQEFRECHANYPNTSFGIRIKLQKKSKLVSVYITRESTSRQRSNTKDCQLLKFADKGIHCLIESNKVFDLYIKYLRQQLTFFDIVAFVEYCFEVHTKKESVKSKVKRFNRSQGVPTPEYKNQTSLFDYQE